MIMGSILLGALMGATATAAALVAGLPLLLSLALYPVVGAFGTLALAILKAPRRSGLQRIAPAATARAA